MRSKNIFERRYPLKPVTPYEIAFIEKLVLLIGKEVVREEVKVGDLQIVGIYVREEC